MTRHHDIYPVYVGKHTDKIIIIEYHVPIVMDWLDEVNVVVPERYVESIEMKVNLHAIYAKAAGHAIARLDLPLFLLAHNPRVTLTLACSEEEIDNVIETCRYNAVLQMTGHQISANDRIKHTFTKRVPCMNGSCCIIDGTVVTAEDIAYEECIGKMNFS